MKEHQSVTLDRKPETCPKCGAPVYPILYGFPMMSEEDCIKTYGEHVIYGGCCITFNDPEWACSKCGLKIYQSEKGIAV